MDKTTLYAKTGKGLLEVKNRSRALSKDLFKLLTLVDGRSTYADLREKLAPLPDRELVVQLRQLSDLGFVKEMAAPVSHVTAPAAGMTVSDDLDFTALMGGEATRGFYKSGELEKKDRDEAARRESEARSGRVREEAERKQQLETRQQVREDAMNRAQVEAQIRARTGAERVAREQAELLARREAEMRARLARETADRIEAERLGREEAERRAREESERRARLEQEAQQRLASERQQLEQERQRLAAEARKIKEEAERKAREDLERRLREEAERTLEEEARLVREAAERRIRDEAQRKLEAETQRLRQEAEVRIQEETRRKVEEEARRVREEAERVAREEARRQLEVETQRLREEAERKAREDVERQLAVEREKMRAEAEELRRQQDEDRRRRDEEERRQLEEQARRLREDQERLRRETEEAQRRQEEEMLRRQEEEVRQRRELEARLQRELEERARREAELAALQRANDEARRRETEEAERRRLEEEALRARELEAKRLADEARAAEEAARREAEKQRREAEERRQAEAEAERKRREESERQAREAEVQRLADEARAQEEAARREAGERSRAEAEEADRKRREEAERQAREVEAQRLADEARAQEEAARREAEERSRAEAAEAGRRQQEDADRRARELDAERLADEARAEEEAARGARAAEVRRLLDDARAREDSPAGRGGLGSVDGDTSAVEALPTLDVVELEPAPAVESPGSADADRRHEEIESLLLAEIARARDEASGAATASGTDDVPVAEPVPSIEDAAADVPPDATSGEIVLAPIDLPSLDLETSRASRAVDGSSARLDAARSAPPIPTRAEREAQESRERSNALEIEARRALDTAEEEARLIEAEERKARAAADAEARTQLAQTAREDAVLRARQDAERRQREKEERRQKEEEARRRAEMQRHDAERNRREQALAQQRAEQEEHDRQKSARKALLQSTRRSPLSRAKPVLIAVVVVIAGAVGLLHVVPVSFYAPTVAQVISKRIGEPVTVGALRISVVPAPELRLSDVRIGERLDIRADEVRVRADLGSVFGHQLRVKRLDVDRFVADAGALPRIAGWVRAGGGQAALEVRRIVFTGVRLSEPDLTIPDFNGDVLLGPDGVFRGGDLRLADGSLSAEFSRNDEGIALSVRGRNWKPSYGPAVVFDEFTAKGLVDGTSIRLRQIEAQLYGGSGKGTAQLDWNGSWRLKGEFTTQRVQLYSFMDAVTRDARSGGELESRAQFDMRASEFSRLYQSPQVQASFTVKKGNLDGVDLVRALQGPKTEGVFGGKTRFDTMSGTLVVSGGRYQYRDLRLQSGVMVATGQFDIAADQQVGGRVLVELEGPTSPIRSSYSLTGDLKTIALKP
jgi:hypothetical protein